MLDTEFNVNRRRSPLVSYGFCVLGFVLAEMRNELFKLSVSGEVVKVREIRVTRVYFN